VKYLIPVPDSAKPRLKASTGDPEDVARLVAVASAAGYTMTPEHASAIWKAYSDRVCAAWLVLPTDDSELLHDLLGHSVVRDDPYATPPPPDGYGSWLDYAVATMDVRSLELAALFSDGPSPHTRDAFREAAMAELSALRRAAGL